MTEQEIELWEQLQKVADEKHDGHLTILKFTTNWRVAFFTHVEREQVEKMAVGTSFAEAAQKALSEES